MLHAPLVITPSEFRPRTRTPSEDFRTLRDPFMCPPRVSLNGAVSPLPIYNIGSRPAPTGIPRNKSTTSLPRLMQLPPGPYLRETSKPSTEPLYRKSRQRRVNSEPMVLLPRPPRVHLQAAQELHILVDGSGE